MDYGFKPTKEGRELLAACLATGKGLEITRVAVGSGKVSEGTDLADMTDLVQYVAEGTIAERRHMDNAWYLTIQYASNYTPGLGAFYLAEFIVQARHPVSGESKTILYATLGDMIQPVSAYSESKAPDVRQYPVILAISDEINVTISAAAGLVTYADLANAVDDKVEEMIQGGNIVTEETIENDLNAHNEDKDAHSDIRKMAEDALKKSGGNIVIGTIPPETGPSLWFCSNKNWTPDDTTVATAELGDPEDAEDADATAEIDGVTYPINNTEVTEENGQVVATIQGV
jgi:hypothetical protein